MSKTAKKSTKTTVSLPKRFKIMAAMAATKGHPGGFRGTIDAFVSSQGTLDEYKRTGYKGAWWRKGGDA